MSVGSCSPKPSDRRRARRRPAGGTFRLGGPRPVGYKDRCRSCHVGGSRVLFLTGGRVGKRERRSQAGARCALTQSSQRHRANMPYVPSSSRSDPRIRMRTRSLVTNTVPPYSHKPCARMHTDPPARLSAAQACQSCPRARVGLQPMDAGHHDPCAQGVRGPAPLVAKTGVGRPVVRAPMCMRMPDAPWATVTETSDASSLHAALVGSACE